MSLENSTGRLLVLKLALKLSSFSPEHFMNYTKGVAPPPQELQPRETLVLSSDSLAVLVDRSLSAAVPAVKVKVL